MSPGIKNVSTQVDPKKSIFNLNKSWKESLSSIVKAVSENKAEVMLINGVVNSGKSTFATCLINQLLSRT
jgi:polynucleotide 5'-kinase involved in rRNA processing